LNTETPGAEDAQLKEDCINTCRRGSIKRETVALWAGDREKLGEERGNWVKTEECYLRRGACCKEAEKGTNVHARGCKKRKSPSDNLRQEFKVCSGEDWGLMAGAGGRRGPPGWKGGPE